MFIGVIVVSLITAIGLIVMLELNRINVHKSTIENIEKDISSSSVLFDLKGANGRLIVCEDKVIIIKDSQLGDFDNSSATNKTIPITYIKSVRFQEGTMITNGLIQFDVSGERRAPRSSYGAYYDENTVLLKQGHQTEVGREIKKHIEKIISKSHDANTVLMYRESAADEILKLKQLLDIGAITHEEFDAKKKQLLGL